MKKKTETFITIYTKYNIFFFKKPYKEFYTDVNQIKSDEVFFINDKQSYRLIFKMFSIKILKKIKSFVVKIDDIISIEEKQVDYYEA